VGALRFAPHLYLGNPVIGGACGEGALQVMVFGLVPVGQRRGFAGLGAGIGAALRL
jgi:hypothetical protein